MNLKWLAGVDYSQKKKPEQNQAFLASTQHQVFCLIYKKNSPDKQYF